MNIQAQKHTADAYNILINIPLYSQPDGENGGLEELARAMHIKYDTEITQEELSGLCATACNSHYELLEACKLALTMIKNRFPSEHGMEDVGQAWGACEQAILKAEGK